MTSIKSGTFKANVALPIGANPLPSFRDPKHDALVRVKPQVSSEYTALMGLDCGKRSLPYQIQDRYDRNREEQEIPAIIMENDYLKATFLPTLGGRLISLIDKENDRELLYCNTSLQACNLSNLDAWFAGGIEWNIGQYGHAFTTCSDVFASIQKDEEGVQFLRLSEYERCKDLWWHIDFHLGETSRLLHAHVHIHNLSGERKSLYYWTNTALPVTDKTRVLASSNEALYLDPYAKNNTRLFGHMKMPRMEIYEDIDASYPNQFKASNEYFFLCKKSPMPWECAIEGDGRGFFEVSTHPLSYRKMFCWGSHAGGKRWQRYLSPDSEDEYIEVQSGLAPSQLHGSYLEAQSSICWTQAFGSLEISPQEAHSPKYEVAMKAAEDTIHLIIDEQRLRAMHQTCLKASERSPELMIHQGSGWAFLAQKAQNLSLPVAFHFGRDSIKDQELPYLGLLTEGKLPVMDPNSRPLSAPPCSDTWKAIFMAALRNPCLTIHESATLNHYLGIIHLEQEEVAYAQTCWLKAMENLPNAWTARNLAQLEMRRGEVEEALRWYSIASNLSGFKTDPAIAEEYCALLVAEQKTVEAQKLFQDIPSTWMDSSEALRITRAKLAVQEKDAPLIKSLVFDREIGHIREGDTPLNSLWFSYQSILYSEAHPEVGEDEVARIVKEWYPIPQTLDFMMCPFAVHGG
jgi:tetratricopeptide (TPR) repeat protein